ncbi:MAG: MgtC/SapB family protein [Clostridia bacterium]|nr:MgtC/SapB family protein [Clostridia bacterium]
MMQLLHEFGQPLDLTTLVLRIVVAVLIGAVIGIDREIKNRPAGMRTHVLVCVGAALVSLIEQGYVADVVALGLGSTVNASMGRITSTVVSGVGFLGAGTIFVAEHKISGLTTAASLWCTACIGLAVGAGYILMAVLSGAIVLIILKLMQRIVHVHTLKKLEVQFIHRQETLTFLGEYFSGMGVKVLDVDFHAETRKDVNIYTNLYTLTIPTHTNYVEIIATLSEHPNIRTVRTRNV